MERGTAGFFGGIAAGFFKLVIDGVAVNMAISISSTTDTVSRIFFGASGRYILLSWVIYMVITGLVGWIISKIISNEFSANFYFSGAIIGVILWALMNIVFVISGISTPTWSMGISTFIVNLLSHIVLGIVIVYSIAKFHVKATD